MSYLHVTVPGIWYEGWSYSGEATAIEFWDDPRAPKTSGLAKTPGAVEFKPGGIYFFSVQADVDDSQIAGMVELATISGVQQLDFYGCSKITDIGISHIKGFSSLTYLCLAKCAKLTETGLAILGRFSALRQLDLTECNATDGTLHRIRDSTGLKQLKHLDLSMCMRITDQGLQALKDLTALTSLSLKGCEGITDDGITHLRSITTLRGLVLRGCRNVSDAGIAHLYQKLFDLEDLELRGCDRVTNNGLAFLKSIVALKRLNLEGCSAVSDDGLRHLTGHRSLKELKLSGTDVSEESVRELKKKLPECMIRWNGQDY